MTERSFDEMIAYFNRRVASMDINQDYKMELLGMVTALGFKHEKSEPRWIPCSERLPNESDYYLVTIINPFGEKEVCVIWFAYKADYYGVSEWRELTDDDTVLAWMPLPKPWKGVDNE